MTIAESFIVPHTPLDILDVRHRRRDSALAQLVAVATRSGVVRDPDVLLDTLQQRERMGSTALGKGVAVPHAHSIAVSRTHMVLGRSVHGLEWRAADGEPIRLAWLVLTPSEVSDEQHHARVAQAVSALRLQRQRQRLFDAANTEAAVRLLREWNAWMP
ncbi:MAG: PTS sugar transporter subunit IIA [Candidatus Eisenbacteria bacterium]